MKKKENLDLNFVRVNKKNFFIEYFYDANKYGMKLYKITLLIIHIIGQEKLYIKCISKFKWINRMSIFHIMADYTKQSMNDISNFRNFFW